MVTDLFLIFGGVSYSLKLKKRSVKIKARIRVLRACASCSAFHGYSGQTFTVLRSFLNLHCGVRK